MSVIDRAVELRATIEDMATGLDDVAALDNAELFPNWNPYNHGYKVGDRLRYNGVLYRVLQSHYSQPEWAPDESASLYAKVLIPTPGVVPEWEQPLSTNGYGTGDRVTHMGKVWESLVDNNVWEPGALGTDALWREVAE